MGNDLIKKIIRILIISIIIISISVIILDFANITKYIPFTRKFDWLNIIGTIIGGLIGALSTFCGIYFTIENERRINKVKELEEKKRTGYSYVIFSENPIIITAYLDSSTGIQNSEDYYSMLIGENVNVNYAKYIDIDFEFINLNSNITSGVIINEVKLLYEDGMKNKKRIYKKYINLLKYDEKYKKITIKGKDTFAFTSRALINNKSFEDISNNLFNSKRVDIIADISFINPNGIITRGNFRANLQLKNTKRTGSKNHIGSNTIINSYSADNTYLTIEEIIYVEDMTKIIYK